MDGYPRPRSADRSRSGKAGLRKKIQPLLHHPRAVHFIELLPFHHGLHLPVPVLSRARAEPVWL